MFTGRGTQPPAADDGVEVRSTWSTFWSGDKGVAVDPSSLRVGELERLPGRYATEILPLNCSESNIPAPKVDTDEKTKS